MTAPKVSVQDLIARKKRGWSMDGRFYTDPEIFSLEMDRILTRNWVLAGHVS